MPRAALLLRGINVGRSNRLRMPDLVALVEGVGCTEVSTHLQSGNVLVTTGEPLARVCAQVQEALAASGVVVPVLARTAEQLAATVADNPWRHRDLDPARLHVAFLSADPDPGVLAAVDHASLLPEELQARGDALFLWYAEGVQRSRLERVVTRLGVTATARNWRTVLALQELLGPV